MQHTVNPEVLETVQAFILKTIPHDSAFIVKPKAPIDMSVKELKTAVVRLGLHSQAIGFSEKCEFVALLEKHYASS